jgi:hypothetical protein
LHARLEGRVTATCRQNLPFTALVTAALHMNRRAAPPFTPYLGQSPSYDYIWEQLTAQGLELVVAYCEYGELSYRISGSWGVEVENGIERVLTSRESAHMRWPENLRPRATISGAAERCGQMVVAATVVGKPARDSVGDARGQPQRSEPLSHCRPPRPRGIGLGGHPEPEDICARSSSLVAHPSWRRAQPLPTV